MARGSLPGWAQLTLYTLLGLGAYFGTEGSPVLRWAAVAAAAAYVCYELTAAPVSMPPPPMTHPLKREPAWDSKKWSLDRQELGRVWTCSTGDESHKASAPDEARLGVKLSGEAAGRQTWRFSKPAGGGNAQGEHKENAFEFDPSVNPNVEDAVWRRQQMERWTRNGGALPKTGPRPGTAPAW